MLSPAELAVLNAWKAAEESPGHPICNTGEASSLNEPLA